MAALYKVDVTDKSAIYVDNTRITDRSTKWGLHRIVFSAVCPRDKIVSTVLAAGYRNAVERIDIEPYMTDAALRTATQEPVNE